MSDERKDLPPASSSAFLERTREALSTYLGLRGDKLDRGITLRDLVDSGIAKLNPGFLTGGRRNPIGGVGPAVVDAYEPDLTPPPTPTGFTATAAISNVLVESGAQLYTVGHGHAKSVLYGKEWVSGPLPIFTDARVLTEFQGTVASYATNPATTWHLWLKWVTVDGVPSVTPAGGTNGIVVTTGQDVATLLTALTAQITESQLFGTLGTRINLIDAATGVAGSVNQRLDSQNTNLSAQIAAVAVGTGDGFDTAAIWYFDTAVDGWTGSPTAPSAAGGFIKPVDGTATYLISPSALAVASATFNQVKLRIRKVGTPTWAGKVWWADVAQDLITPGRSLALAAPTFDANGIGVVTVTPGWTGNLDRIRLDLVAVQDVSNYIEVDWLGIGRSAPGASVASVQTESSARIATDGGLLAQNTVKIDVAGLVSGYGLASTAGNAAPTSAFGVRANQFFIAPPATVSATAPTVDLYDGYCWLDTGVTPNVTRYRSGAAWVLVSPALPFVVQVSPTTVNGVAVPAGVYANDLYVKNGTITNAKIANLAVDNAKIASMSVDKLTAGTLQVGAYIQSTNYIPGTSGWHLNANGTLHALAGYLQGVEVRNSAGVVLLNAGDTANDVRNSAAIAAAALDATAKADAAATTATWPGISGAGKPVQYRVGSGGYPVAPPAGAGVFNLDTGASWGGYWATLTRLSRSTGAYLDHTQFQLFGNGGGAPSTAMATLLNNSTSDHVIVVWTFDQPGNYTERTAGGLLAAMKRCGASDGIWGYNDFSSNLGYILIGIPGVGAGNGFELLSGSPAPTYCETTFTIQNGMVNVSGAASQPKIAIAEVIGGPEAIATKLNNAGANVMNTGFFLQTNGYAGGNGVALYDGGLIGKKGGVNQFTLDTNGNAYFAGALAAGIATAAASTSTSYYDAVHASTSSFTQTVTIVTGGFTSTGAPVTVYGVFNIGAGDSVAANQSLLSTIDSVNFNLILFIDGVSKMGGSIDTRTVPHNDPVTAGGRVAEVSMPLIYRDITLTAGSHAFTARLDITYRGSTGAYLSTPAHITISGTTIVQENKV